MNKNPETVYDLIQRSAEQFTDKIALTYITTLQPEIVDEAITFTELYANINRTVRLINEFCKSNTTKKPVTSFLLPNIPDAHYILWGAETAGVANPLNPLLNIDALTTLMKSAETDLIFALGPNPFIDVWEKANAAAAMLPNKPTVIPVAFADEKNSICFDTELTKFNDAPLPQGMLPNPNDIAAYFHTGGTTSTPKLAMHTHANQLFSVDPFRESFEASEGDVGINGLPLFHVAGAIIGSLCSIATGSHAVLPTMGGFRNPEAITHYWQMVERYKVKFAGGIATSIGAIADTPIGDADISSLRFFVTGGAPLPLAVAQAVKQQTDLDTYQVYGMTETAGPIVLPNLSEPPRPGCAGQIIDNVEIRIDSESDIPKAVGEICVRGSFVSPGYLGDAKLPLEDGWLHTGDLGYLDENRLYITGRAKDLIIRSGHNIDPAAIEACLESHPAVTIASAVGKPDAYAGELPVAYVQLHPGSVTTEKELQEYAMKHINERPACPKSVHILEQLPVTAVGKVHKPTLRANAAEIAVREALEKLIPLTEVTSSAEVLPCGGVAVILKSGKYTAALTHTCADLEKQLAIKISLCRD